MYYFCWWRKLAQILDKIIMSVLLFANNFMMKSNILDKIRRQIVLNQKGCVFVSQAITL